MGKGAKSELPPYLTTLRAASPYAPHANLCVTRNSRISISPILPIEALWAGY